MSNLKWILLVSLGMAGCGHASKDSAATADSTNMTKDSTDSTHPGSVGQEISGDDAKFAVKAAAGGMEEVRLGKLAQQKGSTPAVKDFASMMVKEHSAANTELAELAKIKQIVLPQTLDGDAIKLEKDLSAKNGKDFDKAYADAMVKDHIEDTTEFARAIKVVKYPEMLAFAKKTLPTLKMHLEAAQKVQSTQK